jgi:hypothetical protein
MLHEFLSQNREDLIKRCREKVARRTSPESNSDEPGHGVPLFLDHLIKTLKLEQTANPRSPNWERWPRDMAEI